jgi:hypothetical protein
MSYLTILVPMPQNHNTVVKHIRLDVLLENRLMCYNLSDLRVTKAIQQSTKLVYGDQE